LTIFRIPSGKLANNSKISENNETVSRKSRNNISRPIIFLQHGIMVINILF